MTPLNKEDSHAEEAVINVLSVGNVNSNTAEIAAVIEKNGKDDIASTYSAEPVNLTTPPALKDCIPFTQKLPNSWAEVVASTDPMSIMPDPDLSN